jgi:hypothetical protein
LLQRLHELLEPADMTAGPSQTPLRIAQVAPLFERLPPQLYGGTERVVSYLTEDLAGQGHAVTLFASGDSLTAAQLIPVEQRFQVERMSKNYCKAYELATKQTCWRMP